MKKFKKLHNPEIIEFNIDSDLSKRELSTLIENYAGEGLLEYRDEREKQELIQQVKSLFTGNDQYLFLLKFIGEGKHKKSLINTYYDLTADMKKSFLYTSLLYQYGIPMPWSLLRDIVAKDWDEFKQNVIANEGYGILIQDKIAPDRHLLPDLYFKIKHPLIAEILVKEIIKKSEDLFKYFRNIITKFSKNDISVYLANNLLRAISINNTLDESKINKLYDIAFKILNESPHFCLTYSRNLQNRGTIEDLKLGLKVLQESSIDLEYDMYQRNSRFIHRRAVLNHKLSQKYHQEREYNLSREYFEEALDLFEVKLSLDPGSLYSYKDFLLMLIKTLKYWDNKITKLEMLKIQLKTRSLIQKAKTNLQEGIGTITKLQNRLDLLLEDYTQMKERMYDLIDNIDTKPYALLLKYEIFKNAPEILDTETTEEELVEELSNYDYNDEVINFLFDYYGRNLNFYDYRMKFFDLCKRNESLSEKEKLNWFFYHFIANAYSHRFRDAWDELSSLRSSFSNIILTKKYYWKEQSSQNLSEFTGKIVEKYKGYRLFRVNEMGGRLKAKIDINVYKDLKMNTNYSAHLYFTYTGIWAKPFLKKDL